MEKLKHIKQSLLDCAYCQVDNLHNVDAKELGEVIDMIKDIEETIYYYTVTEAMVSKGYSSEYESNNHHKEGKVLLVGKVIWMLEKLITTKEFT